ncbi:hypothetical protein [Nocardioides convexus]|uniref:hypothetical protein n=1 Tax=Nocardioides convexus TaxID=2712224 RepID=UPI00310193E1
MLYRRQAGDVRTARAVPAHRPPGRLAVHGRRPGRPDRDERGGRPLQQRPGARRLRLPRRRGRRTDDGPCRCSRDRGPAAPACCPPADCRGPRPTGTPVGWRAASHRCTSPTTRRQTDHLS